MADPAAFQPIDLDRKSELELQQFLQNCGVINPHDHPPILPAVIAIDPKLLKKAVDISHAFVRAARAAHGRMQTDPSFKNRLLLPFAGHDAILRGIETQPFFLGFTRVDFYLHPVSHELHIIEVNHAPGSLTEHVLLDDFWAKRVNTDLPEGYARATPERVMKTFVEFIRATNKTDVKTVGFIAKDMGCYRGLAEAKIYAEALQRISDMTPVLLEEVEGGVLMPFNEEKNQPIADAEKLDVCFFNPGGTMQERNQAHRWAQQHGILLLPPVSNLPFTNKSFLGTLSSSLHDLDISSEDKVLLKEALLPSFSIEEISQRRSEILNWEGLVLKRDIGSSGKQVYVWKFEQTKPARVLEDVAKLTSGAASRGETWSVQAYIPPPVLEYRNESLKFDIMIYMTSNPSPAVLYGTRVFRKDKANTGQGASFSQLCNLVS